MFELPLHTGYEHPDVWLSAGPALLAFVAGLGVGRYGGTALDRIARLTTSSAD